MAYTDEQKQLALTAYTACRNNATQAAKFCRDHYGLDVSQEQVLRWSKGEYVAPEIVSSAEASFSTIADRFEDAAAKFVQAAVGKIEETEFRDLMYGVAVAADKALLFRGQANSITQSNLSPDERALRLAELITRVQERKQQESQEDVSK